MYEFLQHGARIIILAAIWLVAVYTSLRVWRADLDSSKLMSPRRMVERSVDESLSWLPTREPDALYQGGQIVAKSAVSSTRVFIRRLSDEEIRWYVGTGEPLDKAGAYGAQGKGGLIVARVEGSFSNVVGFPLEKFYELLKTCGLPPP